MRFRLDALSTRLIDFGAKISPIVGACVGGWVRFGVFGLFWSVDGKTLV